MKARREIRENDQCFEFYVAARDLYPSRKRLRELMVCGESDAAARFSFGSEEELIEANDVGVGSSRGWML